MSDPTRDARLELASVSKSFGDRRVLDGLDLVVRAGEVVAITGASGAGKSVLLKLAATLLPPTTGRVAVLGQTPRQGDRASIGALRNRLGMQFQNLGLFAFTDVYGNLAFSLRKVGLSEEAIRERVEPALELLGLAQARDRFPDQISGGMKRRLAIGRVLVKRPELALFDDPVAGLDPLTSERVLGIISAWRHDTGAAVLIASPDPTSVAGLVDRHLVLAGGRLHREAA